MGASKYSPEFRSDGVALYRATPGGGYSSMAKDLGINHEMLRTWVRDAEREGEPAAAGTG
ncbi:transposase [Streptomyces sp. NPDC051133]|uniref:transposase n=1 Tax=Streptomyces sp. NPDC051133 TaxID=3155521 RepID=UPI00342D2B24